MVLSPFTEKGSGCVACPRSSNHSVTEYTISVLTDQSCPQLLL